MNILRMVKHHVKHHGWPEETVELGPATCGQPWNNNKTACQTAHAYAEAIESSIYRDEPFYVFIYHRPCNAHDHARKEGGLKYDE